MNWTRHVKGTLTLVLGLAGTASAQQTATPPARERTGIVTGQVLHAVTRRPVGGAQIYVTGAAVGTISNAEGKFTIPGVPSGLRTIRFQSVGYGSTERMVTVETGVAATVNFEVFEQAIAMNQIVVTALGIDRAERSLGYAVQTVRAADFERSPELTFVNSLAGQTAGTQITQSTGQPGGSARLVIRGEGSFRGDGQPLYVIDGVPLTVDIDRIGYDPLVRGESGSRAMDIDPANIEEISILRGAAATALYGSRAALGAVIIRTKQGTPGSPMRFSLSTRFGQEEPILEGLQTSWAAGVNGFYCNGVPASRGGFCQAGFPGTVDPTVNLSWGPHRDSVSAAVLQQNQGAPRFRDPRADFYKTGLTSTHSLYGTGSMPRGTYGLGFSYTNQAGVFTSSRLDRMNLNANLSLNLNRALSSHTTILYSNTANDVGFEGQQGLTALVSVLPPTRDISVAANEDGSPVMFGSNTPHPRWIAENEYSASATQRFIAAQTFAFAFGRGFTLSNQLGLDSYLDDRREYQNERAWLTTAGIANGGTRQMKITRRTINNDLVLRMDDRPIKGGNFSLSGLVGANIYASAISDVSGWGFNLSIPGFYNLSNFSIRAVSARLPAQQRLVGGYTQATVDYKDWAYLTLSGRNDWSSTLPTDDNAYFYPSASLAVVFSEALGLNSALLDYGKVRVSLSKVGSDAPPYRLSTGYVSAGLTDYASGLNIPSTLGFPFRTVRGFVIGDQYGNPDIKPEQTIETELGFELRLLDGHARADISLYDRRSYDQIFSVPVAASTGFKSVTRNAGDLGNRGIELSLGVTPLRSPTFTWDARLNLARNWSSVDELAEGVNFIPLAGPNAEVRITQDDGYGVIWGTRYQRNAQGQLLIGADGFPLVDTNSGVLGQVLPDLLANFGTSLRYRGIGVSGLIDLSRGSDILNADLRSTIPAGTAAITEQRNDRFTFDGVSATTGAANATELIRNQAFWTRYAAVDENLVESGNVVRLREISLTYTLPAALNRLVDVQGMTLFASGRNLKVWTPFSYGDPDGNNYGAVNAGGPAFRLFTVPNTRTYSLGIRASF